jgi:membrane-associated HD superfamily phosphohydrolase
MPTDRASTEKIENKSILCRIRQFCCFLTDKVGDRKNETKVYIVLLFVTSLLLTLLIVPDQHFVTSRFNSGDIAATDIKATQGYLLEDQILTEKKRDAAKASVPFTYNFYPNKAAELTERFSQVFSMVEGAEEGDSADKGEKLLRSASDVLGCSISAGEMDALRRAGSSNNVLSEINRILTAVFEHRIISEKRLFAADKSHGIVIIDANTGKIVDTENFTKASSTIDIEEAGRIVQKMRIHVDGTSGDHLVLKGLLVKALQPNLVFDRDATEKKKSEAAEAVRPVLFQVKRGEMIVREGERISGIEVE